MEDIEIEFNSSLNLLQPQILRRDSSTILFPLDDRNSTVIVKDTCNLYEWRFLLPMYIVIFVLSITGNSIVIATLAHSRQARTITNIYLVNLATSDLMLSVFCMPSTLIGQIYRQFLFGSTPCKLIPFLQAVAVSVDVWTLVAISLERYFAICCPLKSREWQTPRHAYKMIFIVWLFSIVVNAPILYVSTLQPVRGTDTFKCREVWPSDELERAFNLGLNGILLVVPLAIMFFAYLLIVKKLWIGMKQEIQHNFNWQNPNNDQNEYLSQLDANKELTCKACQLQKHDKELGQVNVPTTCTHMADEQTYNVVRSTHIKKSIKAKRKVIRMLFVIMAEFFICWTPLHVTNTIYLYYPVQLYNYIGPKGVMWLQLLAYCASCTNPITYCFMNRKFRQQCINLCKGSRICRCCSKKVNEHIQVIPQPGSTSHVPTACVIKGLVGRYEMDGHDAEDCV